MVEFQPGRIYNNSLNGLWQRLDDERHNIESKASGMFIKDAEISAKIEAKQAIARGESGAER